FDTVLALDTTQDPDTHLHTMQMTIEKQKDGVAGIEYFFESREIEVGDDDRSLVLDPADEDAAKKDLSKKSKVTNDDLLIVIKALAPNGTPLTKRQVAKELAARLGLSIDGVERALDRAKGKEHDPYKKFRSDNMFIMPSAFRGAEQTFADQMAEFEADAAAAA